MKDFHPVFALNRAQKRDCIKLSPPWILSSATPGQAAGTFSILTENPGKPPFPAEALPFPGLIPLRHR